MHPTQWPRISIITPSFNQADFLEATIESVLTQHYDQLEYWIIDGGSTDRTVEILKSYGDRLNWLSEKDAGQADAVNKGFGRAGGEIVGWLNSDDTYLPETLRFVGEFFSAHPEVDIVYGEAYYVDRAGKILEPYPTRDYAWGTLAYECYICQPALFFRRKILATVGMLDPDLHFCMDYDFWLRAFRSHAPVRLERFLSTSRMYPQNKTLSERRAALREVIHTVKEHYGFVPYKWIFAYASYLWHRNDQYFDPKPTKLPVVVLAVAGMCWYNRSAPGHIWGFVKRREFRTCGLAAAADRLA